MATTKVVLFVSDASDLRLDELSERCKSERMKLIIAQDASSGRDYIQANGLPHLAVIDMGLPDRDGAVLCTELAAIAALPMIVIADTDEAVLSAADALLEADDFVRRHEYSVEELVARILRILSRVHNSSYGGQKQIPIAGSLKVDLVGRQIISNKEQRSLTPIENSLLSVLLTHRGRMVDGRTLVDRVWPFNPGDFSFNALRVHMHRLRRKIEDDPKRSRLISTDRGIGYRLQE